MHQIKLAHNQYTMVDDLDYEKIKNLTWHLRSYSQNQQYAVHSTSPERKTIWMHRFIMDAPKGKIIDHIDGNGLNNQRSNLRFCTQLQNCANRRLQKNNKSGFKGVTFVKSRKKWRAEIGYKRKGIFLGHFNSMNEAVRIYEQAAVKYFGNFIRQNL